MTGAVDPLAFAVSALEARGALVEPGAGGLLAVLPDGLATSLGLPETARLSLRSAPGQVAVGLGSALLDRLVSDVRAAVPCAAVRVDAAPPRPRAARALAERFVLRNAVSEVGEVVTDETTYALAWAAWAAQADDRHDGLVRAVACTDDGSEPEPGWAALPDPTDPQRTLGVGEIAPRDCVGQARGTERVLCARLSALAHEAVEPALGLVRRRHRRDHERIAGYYAALADEARGRRRRVDPEALAAKLEHLAKERDAKLHELADRFTLRVSLEPVAVLLVELPAVRVHVRVRRRKREGELVLRLPAGATALDAITCAGCLTATSHPVVCDDELHALCERCVPRAEGRPSCPRCTRGRSAHTAGPTR